ncbi:5'-methylthioadenosine/S-adenosylhomocysteine nucleosidase [Spiroplasma culicicola]|uniref:adenosylhomocysteine nucleosidase n=1 Tax=Spiroplasma culicicola AES-1 TaxID=1276246 RepID=W6A7T9_9MOLU|nr:5'-methylthioadenosine/S-adenosylhomocysteine nucleosidase [Spiroplasma culicicola]AHI53056.1 5'-methylthioadenosine/S-adenosylhomocysteine nucleosidase [Spiroplasma culicicola AES-1]
MNICLLFAMEDEASVLIESINAKKICEKPFKIYQTDNVLIAISGIGLVNASVCLTYMNFNYDINSYINAGLVGCISEKYQSLDVLLINKAYYSCANATGFGYEYGQIPKMPLFFETNSTLKEEIISPINNLDINNANIASSDIFINSFVKKEELIDNINDQIDVVDMECAAFFHSAYLLNKPIAALKIVSDTLSRPSNEFQFKNILMNASQKLAQILIKYLSIKK